MPIFEYICAHCTNSKEILVLSITEAPIKIWCDKCGGIMGKVMSAPAIIYEIKEARVNG